MFVGGATTLNKRLDKTKSFQSSRNLYAHTALNKSSCETQFRKQGSRTALATQQEPLLPLRHLLGTLEI